MARIRIGRFTALAETLSIQGGVIAIDGEVLTEGQNDKARATGSLSVTVVDGILTRFISDTPIAVTGNVQSTVMTERKA